jgi:two-component system, chemotaxis family, chemotaxis protein CheY
LAKKVLIVDDSPTVRQQVRAALTLAGFDVSEAVDGAEGVERIQQSSDLAAVVCDVNMPRLNGIELVEKICKDPARAGLPILMLTTEAQAATVQRAKAAGAKGWMLKPFKAELLVMTLKKLTEGR